MTTTKPKWHVEQFDDDAEIWEIAGWLPGNEPNSFSDRSEAEDAARRLANHTPYKTRTRVVKS